YGSSERYFNIPRLAMPAIAPLLDHVGKEGREEFPEASLNAASGIVREARRGAEMSGGESDRVFRAVGPDPVLKARGRPFMEAKEDQQIEREARGFLTVRGQRFLEGWWKRFDELWVTIKSELGKR